MIKEKSDLILFGKQIVREGLKYRLYFADEKTLDKPHPQLYQMICLRKKKFCGCELGKVYDVSYRKHILHTMSEAGDIEITEDVFQKLLNQRDDLMRHKLLSPFFRSYAANPKYYTFEEIKSIMALKPKKSTKFYCNGLCTFLHLLSCIIPFLLFLYSAVYYYMEFLPSKFWHANYFMLLPVYYFLSIPFMIYLMTLFYLLADSFLLHNNYLKPVFIQKEAYKSGGIRQGSLLNQKQKSRLLLYGILFGGAYLVFWLVMLLL